MSSPQKLKSYYFTAIISLLFAMIGFSYNAWRMEVSESNNNIRTASFEVLKELAELETVIFAAHYDKDTVKGNPRYGWVKVGFISDLSVLIDKNVELKAEQLKSTWSDSWQRLVEEEAVVQALTEDIDKVRAEIKTVLVSLQ